MAEIQKSEHDSATIVYRVRTEVVAQIFDTMTGEVIVSGSEEEVKKLYRILKRRN